MCVHIDNVSVCQTILLLLFIAAEDWTMPICGCSGTLLDRRLSKFLHSRTGSWMRSTTNEIRKVWLTSFWIGPKRKVGKLPSLFSKERNYVQLHVWCALKFSRWIYIYPNIHTAGIIPGMGLANEGRRYIVTSSLIGWVLTQNDLYSGVNMCCVLLWYCSSWFYIFFWFLQWHWWSYGCPSAREATQKETGG